jgi:TetR/AcrR family transcriptional regulator, transcriptional repressor for nem operon
MRYDAQHKERTRRRVLAEAAEAVRLRGTSGIGVARIMAKAGLTHGGFYAHFKSKAALLAAAIEAAFEQSFQVFSSSVRDREPARGFATFVERYLSVEHRDAAGRGCPLPSLSGEAARLAPQAAKSFAAGAERLTHAMAETLRAMGKPDARELASSILAEMVGALALARALRDPRSADAALKASRDAIGRQLSSYGGARNQRRAAL